ncbi:MAG: ATP-binding cassette domain-containing protein [Pseudomonadota bacterium]
MIEFDRVSKSFWTGGRHKLILHEASFRVVPGRHLGILAPNGTGKTTLIRLMAGLERPDHGRIRRRGRISWPIGASGGLVPTLSGAENVRYIARLYQVDEIDALAFTADFAELGHYFEMPVRTYSSGMRARLVFGLVMALDFDFYLVDEGASAGDRAFNRKASALFRNRLGHATLVMVSHSTETLSLYCDRFAVLRDGRLGFYNDLARADEVADYV